MLKRLKKRFRLPSVPPLFVCMRRLLRFTTTRLPLWSMSVRAVLAVLLFATVRGAGHMVPTYQPRAAQVMIARFVNGTAL